jgi:hypothetical protein
LIISTDAEKAFCMIKALMQLGIERIYLYIIKAVYDKSTASVILNGEKLKPFPLKSGSRQGYPLSIFIQHSLGITSQNNKTGRRNKRNTNRKGRSQTIPICRGHDLIPKRPEKLLYTINSFSKVAGYKTHLQTSVAFLHQQ